MTMVKVRTQKISDVTRGAFPWWLIQNGPVEKTLIVIPDEVDVPDLVDDIKAIFKLPAEWGSFKKFSVEGYEVDNEPERQAALYNWLFGRTQVLVCSKEGLELPCDSAPVLRDKSYFFKMGTSIRRHNFEEVLSRGGYSRSERVEQVGEYSIRGEVIDVWPPDQNGPIRILWNLDTVEAIRPINLYSQRSDGFLRELRLFPVLAGTGSKVMDLVPENGEILLFEPADIKPDEYAPPPVFSGHMNQLREQLIRWNEDDWRVAIFCHNPGERDRLEELLEDPYSEGRGTKMAWHPSLVIAGLEHGFIHLKNRLAVLTNSEIFGRYRKRVRIPKFEGSGSLSSVLDIKKNDFLVHEKHGVGRYHGLKSLKVGDITSEYLNIEYKGGDRLYVPIFEFQQVQKYSAAEGKRPPLSSLDTAAWERIKSKVKEDVAKLAAELLSKAAKRKIRPGFAFPAESHIEQEFAASFVYELTADQKKTWEEVSRDMMNPNPMDRLVCGDVGYGKTEIAMRAALKCVVAGKQVVFLCPTTILAEQHARNFGERLQDYPTTVALISRFQSKSEQKVILEDVRSGKVDLVIGTHRLLSKDVGFKNLGLIIIDEEHRFGVKQKNKLIAMRSTVDVLSLTATPIPRTLASAMGGIKNLSVIETPPQGRLPISTHVGLFDEDLMTKAVQNELDRGGQVFYVHNRVKTLISRQKWLQSMLPGVRIGIAHGQMKEHELEETMHNFLHRKVDILLATTIIESGLDIPSVNTLIVEEAEEMGLAQLYQLRGRVGRSRTRAYCYLFYESSGMSTDAKKRLEALKEYTALGSGFRLAMRDMEIRGAGNLLGHEQHGNMTAVGIETYSRLLNEEIEKQKGKPVDEQFKGPVIEISMSAYIPEEYMPSESERVQMYKRILSAPAKELTQLKEELIDRCGSLPIPAKMLFDAAALRLVAGTKGISEVNQGNDDLVIYFRENFKMPDKAIENMLRENGKTLTLIQGPPMGARVKLDKNQSGLDVLGQFIRAIFET